MRPDVASRDFHREVRTRKMRGMSRLGALLLALVVTAGVAGTATAQVPVFHGFLRISQPGKGRIDRNTADGMLKVRKWTLLPSPDSNGIFPDQEPVRLTIWIQPGVEQPFDLPAGALVASKNGNVFSYRAPEPIPAQSLERFRIWKRKDGNWSLRFKVQGIHFDRLITDDPICFPLAIIVG